MRPAGFRGAATIAALVLAWGIGGAAPVQDSGEGTRDVVRVREKPEEQPWLRINVGGHTASVRALTFTPDSSRLCSAGLDKGVQVWNLKAAFRDLRRVYLRERTIRWQVARGLRGSIYALASAPSDGLLAIGGYGAANLGEILLVDPVQGTLVRLLGGHHDVVCSLAFSPDGNWLASMDVGGQAMLWKRGGWDPITLCEPDWKTHGPETAALIAKQPKFRPITFAGSRHVILPEFAGLRTDGRLKWKLTRIDVTNPNGRDTLDTLHYDVVTALAGSADGARLASADLRGVLYLWDLKRRGDPDRLERGVAVPISLCFSPDGRTLVAGTAVGVGESGKSQLQVWDVGTQKIKDCRFLDDHVYACISPDGKRLAYSGGQQNEVFVESLEDPGTVVPLRGKGRRILKVAFAKEAPLYRVAFGSGVNERGFNDYADLEATFDPVQLELSSGDPPEPSDWLPADWCRGDWRAERQAGGTLQLYQNDTPKGTITLDPVFDGTPRCYCWIADRQGKPFAIAVGTDKQNSVYVCRLVEEGPCPILRHFRGHHDYVTSVGVSHDLQYLVSGSADGTIRFWSLAGYQQGTTLLGRWGADFSIQGERLVVADVQEAGPLFRKGVRKGDVLDQIRWHEDGRQQSEQRPAEMLERLGDSSWTEQLVFETSRNGVARPAFQRVPAWESLATLFVSTDREWAFWTPEGYYDASLNGHTLFGWQVNRGVDAFPDFYRADQFRKRLERPDVMRGLLRVGSLEGALQQAAVRAPAESHEILPAQIAATPRVDILSPRSGAVIQEGSTRVTARIKMPKTGNLVRARVFANGVVATRRQLIDQRDVEDGKELTYAWDAALPADERNLIQLVVATDAPTTALGNVVVERGSLEPAPAERRPKLYLMAVGINEYGDSGVPRLSYSVADAEAVTQLLRSGSKGLYALDEVAVLTNKDVTPESWRESLQQLSEKLKELTAPDDLLVLFLAGHGIVDADTQRYYFLGHDFRLDDLDKGVYTECISWDDFQALADVPCRKLALLDTCHSGAVQPLRSYHLKAAVRALQEDVIFTVTASAGHERAAENKDWGHGVFTKCLLEALEGRADDSRDGVVTLDEVVAYVTESVSKSTERRQNPTAGPEEILRYTTLPLTRVAEERTSIPAEADHVTFAESGRPGEGAQAGSPSLTRLGSQWNREMFARSGVGGSVVRVQDSRFSGLSETVGSEALTPERGPFRLWPCRTVQAVTRSALAAR